MKCLIRTTKSSNQIKNNKIYKLPIFVNILNEMSKKIDLIYSVLETLREINDDSDFSEEFIADILDYNRAELIKQTLRYSGDVSQDFIQSLERVPVNVNDVSLSALSEYDLNILITDKIPVPLRVKQKEYFTRIGSLNPLEPSYTVIPFERLPYTGKGRFNKTQKYAAYSDNKVYVVGHKNLIEFIAIEYINIKGIFANPDAVVEYNLNSNVSHNWDYEYPLPESLTNVLLKMVLQAISPKVELPSDRLNDASNGKA